MREHHLHEIHSLRGRLSVVCSLLTFTLTFCAVLEVVEVYEIYSCLCSWTCGAAQNIFIASEV